MEKSKCGVCVVGASNMDLITYVDQLPAPGETRKGLSFQKGFGGTNNFALFFVFCDIINRVRRERCKSGWT